MRKCVGVFLLVGLMASVASAAWYWEGDVSNSWADANNWNDGTVSPPASAHGAGDRMNVPSTPINTVSVDVSDTIGYLHMGRNDSGGTIGDATVNLDVSGVTLTVSKGSSELVSVAYSPDAYNYLNVSKGTLEVYRGNGAGELRLNHSPYDATMHGNVNLSGTGVIDVEYLNKGGRNADGTFTATGGTLILRQNLSKFGVVDSGYSGFQLGGARFEVADWSDRGNVIGNVTIGSNESTDFIMDSTSSINFDLGDASGVAGTDWDLITARGNFTLAGQLMVNFVTAPSVGDYWDVLTIYSGYESSFDILGAFDSVPSDIAVSLIDIGNGNDTLRLTYIPEPATIALLGLGLIAIRRNKKQK